MSKIRLDQYLVDNQYVTSRARGQALIIAGNVLVNEEKIMKSGTQIAGDSTIRLLGNDCPYVSRGGWKIEGALKSFSFDPKDLFVLDIGASKAVIVALCAIQLAPEVI